MMESNRDIATGDGDSLEKELQSVEEEITYKMFYQHSKRVSRLDHNMRCTKKAQRS